MVETVMWRSASLAQAIGQIEAELDQAWATLLGELAIGAGSSDEVALGWLVVDDPAEHDWRVVDAALDRLMCTECGSTLTKGPVGCRLCSYYHQVPSLVDGDLPSTKQAQAARALINKLTPEECETVASFAEVEELARTR